MSNEAVMPASELSDREVVTELRELSDYGGLDPMHADLLRWAAERIEQLNEDLDAEG
jgi:hypothetical protein